MARLTKRKCKTCRRLEMSVCGRVKCAIKRRPQPPGMHGTKRQRRRSSGMGYAFQLQAKQRVRHQYGLMERQFRSYVTRATAREGDTGIALQVMLESRLDNVVYRLGFALTRAGARQLVNHGHIAVNGKKVDIASYSVKIGDEISVKESKRETKLLDGVRKERATHETPSWLKLDPSIWTGTVLSQPSPEELNSLFDTKPIIEFYSR